ncbi:type 1 restriction-modification system protein HsdS [Rhizobium phaseoli]|uniref:restriction endonuclease subunit S n=1 Tax=Rhizobium phaseoli TaxID=396 RepID=UPI0007E974FD|nr:restriction endonuclease subunit S [Rhizobium phaseoli]ANL64737.1 type 1 restriction-modification system protein HsdS [Rhizobium phaseoli]ANL77551.1 type 1 restriction-modification system protein HsdS [Rhizobium phaseoli]
MSGLPTGWVEATVSDLCELINGKAFKPSDWVTSGLPIVRIQNLNNSTAGFNFYQGSAEEKFLIDSGQLLFAWSGTPGTSFGAHVWDGGKAILNQHIFKVNFPFGLVDKHFLRNAINQKLEELIGKAHGGAGLQHVTKGKFEETLVSLPPLAEQKRIVAKLDTLNAKSARARTELARIETLVSNYKQAVLSKALNGELTSAEVSSWPMSTLGELAVDVRYGTQEKCTFAPELTPVLRIPNVADGRIDLSDLKHASFNEKELKKLALVEGDLLVIRSNGSVDLVGRSAVVNAAAAGMLFAGYLIRIRLDLKKALPQFVQHRMQSPEVRRAIENAAKSTSGVNNVNSQQLKALQLQLPPLEEQQEIVRRIDSAFANIDRLAGQAKRALELVGRLDEAILTKAFRGELVPQDENDEPAGKLLERIRAERAAAPKAKRGRGRR